MDTTTEAAPAGLEQAAFLRAAGKSWEAVSLAVRVPVEQCQSWPSRYPQQWQQWYQTASERLLEEARAEAVLVLRAQLRSPDERTSREAARELLRLAQAQSASASAPTEELGLLVDYLGGLDDAAVDRLVRELCGLAHDTAAASGSAAGLGDSAG
jgi:hypothetical protein